MSWRSCDERLQIFFKASTSVFTSFRLLEYCAHVLSRRYGAERFSLRQNRCDAQSHRHCAPPRFGVTAWVVFMCSLRGCEHRRTEEQGHSPAMRRPASHTGWRQEIHDARPCNLTQTASSSRAYTRSAISRIRATNRSATNRSYLNFVIVLCEANDRAASDQPP